MSDASCEDTTREIDWGRRYLVCPPAHFDVLYEINPWMQAGVPVDPDRAQEQWEALVGLLRQAGAEVAELAPVEGLPDLVFTANAGIVDGDLFVPSVFKNPERQGEQVPNEAWFAEHGWQVAHLPDGVVHEGAGDGLPFGGVLVGGHRWRTDAAGQEALSSLLGVRVVDVELLDERFYHLDLTFCPLDDRRALVAFDAFDRAGAAAVGALVPEPLALTLVEAATFCANSVVIGRTIVMPDCPPRVGRQLERWGFDVALADVSEFLKAGGGVRCLTLALDVSLRRPPHEPVRPPA